MEMQISTKETYQIKFQVGITSKIIKLIVGNKSLEVWGQDFSMDHQDQKVNKQVIKEEIDFNNKAQMTQIK